MDEILNIYNYKINELIKERDTFINYIIAISTKHNYTDLPLVYQHKLKIRYEFLKKDNTTIPDNEILKNMITNSIKVSFQDFNYVEKNIIFKISNITCDKSNNNILITLEIVKPYVSIYNIQLFENILTTFKNNDISRYIEMFNYSFPELRSTLSFTLKEMSKSD